ncbi:rhodanese-like domain-containing protein [Rhodococcus cerastii]|uniref:Rhodanese-like domain-containing protein n=1 Tax=Rhodococcus cerastii TaxID=908616 RepID=A0ABU4D0I9_9NOCA|nr:MULTISPECIES: rhodanese-like domain-containing protein [Rhodococcus]MDV6302852.1 rhodanese-like domain-containing protein [Rhodococcus cerastii]MDV7990270.1 rhodanese-like domain-containing protein [Rhodococcus sp. IEGM 1374]MDV8079315.1 rhodanese-like domain-containing protein [Rhodococcus sp. IEGM 1370]
MPVPFPTTAILLDVREDDEWQAGHAPDAVHIPMGDIPSRAGEVDNQSEVYVVCKAGGRSARVVEYLNRVGYDAINVDGGMLAWQAAGRPIQSENDAHEARII